MKIIHVSETRTAKDGRQFFVATFRPGFGQRLVKRTFWEQFVNDSKGNKTDKKVWERGTPEEAAELMRSKTTIDAKKETRRVESYKIGENLVNQYSTIVFPDEYNDLPRVFASQNHNLVDEATGEVIQVLRSVTIAPATTPAPGEEAHESAEVNAEERSNF